MCTKFRKPSGQLTLYVMDKWVNTCKCSSSNQHRCRVSRYPVFSSCWEINKLVLHNHCQKEARSTRTSKKTSKKRQKKRQNKRQKKTSKQTSKRMSKRTSKRSGRGNFSCPTIHHLPAGQRQRAGDCGPDFGTVGARSVERRAVLSGWFQQEVKHQDDKS